MHQRWFPCLTILIVCIASCGFFHLKPRKAYVTNYGLCEFGHTETFENPDAITGESAFVDGGDG